MVTGGPQAFLDRRLLFVVGKGGVGKTTVATALAGAAAKRGKRVLLVELEGEDRVRPLLGLTPASATGQAGPEELRPGLFRLNVEGRSALEEYLAMVIPIRRVLRAVFENRVYQYFVAAAPGLKELMTVGKIFYEVDQKRWDLVIVDCPATGHSLQVLRMPKAAAETFPAGLVHREAVRVQELLRDARRTAVVVVTLAEEMPVNETLEICEQIDGDLSLPRGALFVNRVHGRVFDETPVGSIQPPADSTPEERALVEAVKLRAVNEESWSRLNAHYLEKLEGDSDWSVHPIPFLFREEFTSADVEEIGDHLMAAVSGERPKARRRGRSS